MTKSTPIQATLAAQYDAVSDIDVVDMVENKTGKVAHMFDADEAMFMLQASAAQVRIKEQLLTAMNDVHNHMYADDYLTVLADLGFATILQEQMTFVDYNQKTRDEQFYVLVNDLGIILQFDTYRWEHEVRPVVNSAHWFAVWMPSTADQKYARLYLSSGCWESMSDPDWRTNPKYENDRPNDLMWVGDWDAREAVRHKITKLLEHGTFLSQWPKLCHLPFSLFGSHYDYKDPTYVQLSDAGKHREASTHVRDLVQARRERAFKLNPKTLSAILGPNTMNKE